MPRTGIEPNQDFQPWLIGKVLDLSIMPISSEDGSTKNVVIADELVATYMTRPPEKQQAYKAGDPLMWSVEDDTKNPSLKSVHIELMKNLKWGTTDQIQKETFYDSPIQPLDRRLAQWVEMATRWTAYMQRSKLMQLFNFGRSTSADETSVHMLKDVLPRLRKPVVAERGQDISVDKKEESFVADDIIPSVHQNYFSQIFVTKDWTLLHARKDETKLQEAETKLQAIEAKAPSDRSSLRSRLNDFWRNRRQKALAKLEQNPYALVQDETYARDNVPAPPPRLAELVRVPDKHIMSSVGKEPVDMMPGEGGSGGSGGGGQLRGWLSSGRGAAPRWTGPKCASCPRL